MRVNRQRAAFYALIVQIASRGESNALQTVAILDREAIRFGESEPQRRAERERWARVAAFYREQRKTYPRAISYPWEAIPPWPPQPHQALFR
jgi:hypothetical protein